MAQREPDRRRRRVGANLAQVACGLTLASATPSPPAEAEAGAYLAAGPSAGGLAILTYNVKGLPWPAASGREPALARIGARLARLRRQGRQPAIVVLQEAFTPQAKAIGDAAGYAWQVEGPYARPEPGNPVGGSWYLGETQPAIVDSGLVVLSDYPVLAVERLPFPKGDCAGYDCLAAKGVLLVTVGMSGAGPVTIAVTHLNSRKASGAPFTRANAAYARQAEFLGRILDARRRASEPLVLAGDFNRGDRPSRIAALGSALGSAPDAISRLVEAGALAGDASPDVATILRRGRDLQFAYDGRAMRIEPLGVEVPFGTEPDGSQLSDHIGYLVRYRLSPTASRRLASPRAI